MKGVVIMMWWGWDGMDHIGAAGWTMMAVWVIFWIAVIAGIVVLIRYLVKRSDEDSGTVRQVPQQRSSHEHFSLHRSDALRILEEKYARGEIDREEFLRKRSDLRET